MLGEELHPEFIEKKTFMQNSIEEEFKSYKAFPELHPNYEIHYEEFLSDYYKNYGMNTEEDHKQGLFIMFWDQKLKRLMEMELEKKVKELEKEFLGKVEPNVPITDKATTFSTSQQAAPESTDTFSVEKSLNLLEDLSSEFGMVGPSILAIISNAREFGATTSKGLAAITDKESMVLLKMVIEKMTSLQKTCPPPLIPKLIKGVEWTEKLIAYATNPPEDQGLDLMAIAKASLGKDSGFILDLIKTALAYEGLPSMSKEEINQLFMKVCSIHFEMASKD